MRRYHAKKRCVALMSLTKQVCIFHTQRGKVRRADSKPRGGRSAALTTHLFVCLFVLDHTFIPF